MAILILGGMGYIGSHTCVELLENNYDVIIVDNLCNSNITVKEKIEKIVKKKIKFYNVNLVDKLKLETIFNENYIEAVIDFAALKVIRDSIEYPLDYYNNNLKSLLNVLSLMKEYKIRNFVFSSSASVYGNSKVMPVVEESPLSATTPYARTKLMSEDILRDLAESDNRWNIAILRYFNPVGAHESGLIGEYPQKIPSNIMPYISKVALGELEYVNVFGNDYDTIDGTGIRDYVHIMDIANGHLKALEYLISLKPGLVTYNLGSGKGYSVLQLIESFSSVSKKRIRYKIVNRREGDVPICYADCSKANKDLNWNANKNLEQMCKDTWKWQNNIEKY